MASKRFSRIVKILGGAVADADEIFQLDGRLERFVHFWALVVRQFIHHRCFVRASALSFSTLLALIPLLAVALSVTSSLLNPQQEERLTQFVEQTVSSVAPQVYIETNSATPKAFTLPPGMANAAAAGFTNEITGTNAPASTNTPVVAMVINVPLTAPAAAAVNTQKQVATEIHELVQKTSSGTLSSISLLFLIITAVSLLRGIEETFNDLWGVTRGRNWWLQFMLYWMIITLGPALLSSALVLTGSLHLQHTRSFLESSPFLAPVIKHLLPISILGFTLGLLYKVTPNTKVEISAAMIGGFVAGAAWHFYNQLSFVLLSRAVSASKLYGSLMLVPLVMGGLYILWLIILFGAQIAYAYQNRTAYLQDRLAENVNQRGREFVALRIMTLLGQRFQTGLRPATVPQISTELGVPSRLTQSILRTLTATRLVVEVMGAEAAFIPARPLEAINAYDVLMAIRTGTGQELPLSEAPELAEIYGEFARIELAERSAAANVTLFALATRTAPRATLTEPKPVEPEKRAPVAPLEALVVEKSAVPEPVEPVKPAAFPEKIETPAPVVAEAPPRREMVHPAETDFPL